MTLWDIDARDDIVSAINRALAEYPAGIIVFSQHRAGSRYVTQRFFRAGTSD